MSKNEKDGKERKDTEGKEPKYEVGQTVELKNGERGRITWLYHSPFEFTYDIYLGDGVTGDQVPESDIVKVVESAHDQEVDENQYHIYEECDNDEHDYCCGIEDVEEMQDDKGYVEEVRVMEFDCGCKAIIMGERE